MEGSPETSWRGAFGLKENTVAVPEKVHRGTREDLVSGSDFRVYWLPIRLRLQTKRGTKREVWVHFPLGCPEYWRHGVLVAGRKGEQYILSIINWFSRYFILVPLCDHTTTTVSRALYERVIRYFNCPRKILSDRGTEFTGVFGAVGDSTDVNLPLLSPGQQDCRAQS